jgi:hypothetical protein
MNLLILVLTLTAGCLLYGFSTNPKAGEVGRLLFLAAALALLFNLSRFQIP